MNVGQILETHLGWAGKELGNSLKRLLSKDSRAEAVRRWFREVFTDTAIWKTLSKLNDDDLLEVAEGFREGIPFATPVFDGARAKRKSATCSKSRACRTPARSTCSTG